MVAIATASKRKFKKLATATTATRDLKSSPSGAEDFIANSEFSIGTEEEIVECDVLAGLEAADLSSGSFKGPRMPEHLLRLCETRLLRPDQERALFRRMNYAKFRAHKLRLTMRRKGSENKARELAKWDELARQDRNRLIQANVRLVVSIAKKFTNKQNAFDDLLSEGIDSLLRAVEKFDFDRGFRFSTYATQAIRRTLYRTVKQTQMNGQRFIAMDTAEVDVADDAPEETPLPENRWEILKVALQRLLSKLDLRERTIVRHRFGLDKTREITTLQQLAKQLGVCKERVRQIEQRAIEKLRQFAEKVELRMSES